MKILTALAVLLAAAGVAQAQSLLGDSAASPYDPPRRPPFKKHDHVQILVQERTRASSAAELRTDRRSRWEVDLDKWVKFDRTKDGRKMVGADLAGDPGVDLEARMRNDNLGRTTRAFDLCFTISAEVVDIRPNGVLVVQAIKRRKVNDDDELIRLSGEIAPEAVVHNTVLSDRVVNLSVTYEGSGAVSDTAKPGILGWVLNKLWPF